MTIFWPLSRSQVLDAEGRPLLDVRVRFYAAGTSTQLTVYSNPSRTAARSQPVTCDANGRFPRVYLPDGLYAEQVFTVSGGELWFDDNLGAPIVTIETPEPPDVPEASAYFSTGDVKWRPDNTVLPGWVRMNGRTIGDSGSGASERAHIDTEDLYKSLWQRFDDDIATVSGGRGSSWSGDFNAGKPIVVPSMQGRVAVGLDTMGSSAAQMIVESTSLVLTDGSNKATVGTPTRVAIGMLIVADGVPAGTTVVDLNGSTITMSSIASQGGAVNARLGMLDAARAGGAGGDMLARLVNRNLPANLPDGKVTVTWPDLKYRGATGEDGVAAAGSGTETLLYGAAARTISMPDPTDFAVTQPNPGGGVALSVVQPCRAGTWFMKL